MGSFIFVLTLGAPASMPGDDLLFHRLSDSTIGAVGFHGRVRDGIGWGTDAIATKQWSRCASVCEMWVKIDVVHLFKASLSETECWLCQRPDGGCWRISGVELLSSTRHGLTAGMIQDCH